MNSTDRDLELLGFEILESFPAYALVAPPIIGEAQALAPDQTVVIEGRKYTAGDLASYHRSTGFYDEETVQRRRVEDIARGEEDVWLFGAGTMLTAGKQDRVALARLDPKVAVNYLGNGKNYMLKAAPNNNWKLVEIE